MKKEYTTHQVERLEFDYVKAAVPSACICSRLVLYMLESLDVIARSQQHAAMNKNNSTIEGAVII